MRNRNCWQHTSLNILSTRLNGIDDVEITIIQEPLKIKKTTQSYAIECINEMQQVLENFVCVESLEYCLYSGSRGVQKCCQWSPTALENYMQIHGFVVHEKIGYRMFTSLEQSLWLKYGEKLKHFMQTIELGGFQ